jgi:prepilin-type N-terminal cleavage/methylation domain-containing protein
MSLLLRKPKTGTGFTGFREQYGRHNMTGSHTPAAKKNHSGFTLVEMAMVLLIITVLLAGLVPTISSQMEQQRTNETRKQMNEIREALIGFALRNGRLPCAARAATPSGQSYSGLYAGNEYPDCNSSTQADKAYGVVPWITLGTSETDGWGNRFTYRVSSDFADAIAGATYGGCTPSPAPAQASFALCSAGNPDIKSSSGGTAVANDVPAIIISHGKNGAGAYTPKGTQLPAGSADEQENTDHSSDWEYVSRIPTSDFDDLVDWVTANILASRMVTAGKLP